MSKKICKDKKQLKPKLKGKPQLFVCRKCDAVAPKEKWLCKPVPAA